VDATKTQRKRTTEEQLEKEDLEREMWTAGFRFSWRKMETAAQDRAGGDERSVIQWVLGVTGRRSSQVPVSQEGDESKGENEVEVKGKGKKGMEKEGGIGGFAPLLSGDRRPYLAYCITLPNATFTEFLRRLFCVPESIRQRNIGGHRVVHYSQ